MGAAVINYISASDWRVVYFVGAAPALMVLWIRSSVKEPQKWTDARDKAMSSSTPMEIGNILGLFRDPVLRRNTIAGVLLATAGVGGMWGVGFFLPDLNGSVLEPFTNGLSKAAATKQIAQWKSIAFFIQNIGAAIGMFSYAALSQRTGRNLGHRRARADYFVRYESREL